MTVIVTGIAGALGTAVAQALAAEGIDVIGVDQTAAPSLPFPVRIHDLTQRESGYHALAGGDTVIHLANHSHPYGKDAQRMIRDNTAININVFQAAAELELSSILFASSIQTLASDRRISDPENHCTHSYLPLDADSPARPGNPYALSKLLAEQMMQYFHQTTGIHSTALRFPWLARPHQVQSMKQRERYDYMRIDDVFSYLLMDDAARLLATLAQKPLPGHHVFLAAADDTLSSLPVADLVAQYFPDVEVRGAAVSLSGLVDCTPLKAQVDWQPTPPGSLSPSESPSN